jgi:hypothetical protein
MSWMSGQRTMRNAQWIWELFGPKNTVDVEIADGETTSESINLEGRIPTHVALPAGFDGTTLEVQGSMDGSTWLDLYDENNSQISLTVAASRFQRLPVDVYFMPYIRFVAGSQTDAVTLTVAFT